MEEVWSFRYSKPSLPEGPLVELSAAEMERHLLAQLDAPNADKADGLWQLARFHAESKQHDSFSVVGILARARPTRADEGRSRRLGWSLFGSQTFSLLKVALVPNLDFPERTLVVPKESERSVDSVFVPHATRSELGSGETPHAKDHREAASIATQPACLWHRRKRAKTDHPDISRNEWWWDDEPLLLGAAPLHALIDAYRLHLEARPKELAEVISSRPNGPLAVSHIRGNGRKMTKCRYDFIYVPDVS